MSEKDLKTAEGYIGSYVLFLQFGVLNLYSVYSFEYFQSLYYQRLYHLKRAIRMFVNIKSQISLKHEYALMIFQENAFWVVHFKL
jgi:hypothetical protein